MYSAYVAAHVYHSTQIASRFIVASRSAFPVSFCNLRSSGVVVRVLASLRFLRARRRSHLHLLRACRPALPSVRISLLLTCDDEARRRGHVVCVVRHAPTSPVRPTHLDSFGVHPNESRFDATNTPFRTRTDPGSNSGSKEVEANPIDVARCGDDGEWTWTRHVRGTSGAKRGRRVAVGGARGGVHASAAEAWCERNGIDTKAVSRRTTGVCLRSTALAEEEEAVARRADGWQPRMVPACRRSRDVLPPSWTDACRSTTVRRPGEPRTIQA